MTREEARQIIASWLASSKGGKGQCGYIEGWFYEKDVEAFRMAIEALQDDWIPVSERLPEHTGDVLVTVGVNRHGLGMYDETRVATWNVVYRVFCVHESEAVICGEILAWQPLPEPYKGGDTK